MTKQTQEALKMAIECLEYHYKHSEIWGHDVEGTIQACKEALEQLTFLDECIAKIDAEIERNGGAWV